MDAPTLLARGRRPGLTVALAGSLSLAAAGCGGTVPDGAQPVSWHGAPARGGSLVVRQAELAAYAADADNRAIHRIDLLTGEVTTTPVDGAPEQLVVVGEAHLAVTLRDRNRVALLVVEPGGELEVEAVATVATEPWGLATTADGDVLVTSAWGHAVTALDGATLSMRYQLDVAREPRGIAVAPDGRRAFVTHLVGDAITVIDLGERPDARRVRGLNGAYRNRVDAALGAATLHPTAALAYSAVLSPSGGRLFVPHVIEQNGSSVTRSIPGAYGGVPLEEETQVASVAVFATHGEHPLGDPEGAAADPIASAAFIAADPAAETAVAPAGAPCRQARAAVLLGDRLLVASQGTNELVELDATALDPALAVLARHPVGEGPRGVDVEATTRLAVVWNQLSHDVSLVSLDTGSVETISVAPDPLPPALAAGRRLFHTERDRRISRDGRACAGCHPEGRDDGVVWKLGAGPRQTPTLLGRLERGPYGWLGKHPTLEGNMLETMTRLGGRGLPAAQLAELADFVRHGLPVPSRGAVAEGAAGSPSPGATSRDAQVTRGGQLFASETVGCSGCHHLESDASDRAVHEVGSRGKSDTTSGFRTPPLLYVGGTAPYFHDGRYATLEQLLGDNLDRMGQTTQLSGDELRALAAFLRTL